MRVLYHYAAGPVLQARLARLADEGIEVQTCSELDDARFFDLLPETDVIWHCLRPIDADVLAAAPRLRMIQKIGVGVNTIDLDAAQAREIAVCNLPGSNSRAVAEHTLGLMLAVLRKLVTFDSLTRSGRGWDRPPALEDTLGEIAGRSVGLIGYGAVPRLLAPILDAMGARVAYCNRSEPREATGERMTLDALLASSDIISLHLPLQPETQHLLNATRLQRMRPGAILINTSRGGLIDTEALLTALTDHLGGAGLDVFQTEPLPADHALRQCDNVVLSPHVAWLTQETLARSVAAAADNCHRLARGEPLANRIV
ncbi:MAG: hydroxyacid dehydrogenase [Gammaproteobacteria bacterium]|nr:MAG: hydroxyacid dehydrogenase [Gammaproteobacteria bacterium]